MAKQVINEETFLTRRTIYSRKKYLEQAHVRVAVVH